MDAGKFQISIGPTLIFMFNPFSEKVLVEFLQLNRASINQSGSVLVYINDVHRDAIEDSGMKLIFEEPNRNLSMWQGDPNT
jgi:GR25 family glycosyltransferase involved in LPS biosynthesis